MTGVPSSGGTASPRAEPATNSPPVDAAIHKPYTQLRQYRRAAGSDDDAAPASAAAEPAAAAPAPEQSGAAGAAGQQVTTANVQQLEAVEDGLPHRDGGKPGGSGPSSTRSRSRSREGRVGRPAGCPPSKSRSSSRDRSHGQRRGRRSSSRSRSPDHHCRRRSSHSPKGRRHGGGRSRSSSREDGGRSRKQQRHNSRSRSRSRSLSAEGGQGRQHDHRRSHHHKQHAGEHPRRHGSPHDQQHHHQQKKRSRSTSPHLSSRERRQQQSAAVAAAGAQEEREGDGEGGQILRRDSSGGASSLVKLSLRQAPHPLPAILGAAAALLPPPAAARQAGAAAGPSPLPPPGLLPVHTPTAAALAAARGIDISDMALVQPSPMAAEATVAALSALMQQPARPPQQHYHHHFPHAHHHRGAARGAGSGGAAAGGSSSSGGRAGMKQLLSFGQELEEEDEEEEAPSGGGGVRVRPAGGGGGSGGGGMSAATAKRFKHEKTLVMLNPLLGDMSMQPGSYEDDESLPVSPAAPLDKRLGHVIWGTATAKGMRPYMEDRHTVINSFQPRTSTGQAVQDGVFRAYASVFDGHNGASAADHAADRLHHVLAAESAMRTCTGEGPPTTVIQEEERVAAAMIHSFEAVDREIMTRCRLEGTKGGATGLVLLRIGNQLYAAHCGDSRAVMSRNGEALRLTEDHKPNLPRERKRVEGLGGRVDFARCWRVIVDPGDGRPASGLAVSRSFGDPDFKEPLHLVTATPDVIRERLLPGDEFVILASDGLWDVLSDTDACTVVRRHLQQSGNPRQITPPQLLPGAAAFGGSSFADQLRRPAVLTAALATAVAERLVQASLDRGTMDNVTAVVGLLQWD